MEEIRQGRRRRRLWVAIAFGATLLASILVACFSVTSRPQFDFIAKYHGRPIDRAKAGAFVIDGPLSLTVKDSIPEVYEFDYSEATMLKAVKDEVQPNGIWKVPTTFAFVVQRVDASGKVSKAQTNRSHVLFMRQMTWPERQWRALKNWITPPPKKAAK